MNNMESTHIGAPAAAVALIAMLSFYTAMFPLLLLSSLASLATAWTVHQLPRTPWTPATSLDELAALSLPTVLTDTPADGWAARRWTPESLTKQVRRWPHIAHSKRNSRFQYFTPGKPMEQSKKFWQRPYEHNSLTGKALLRKLRKLRSAEHVYVSADLDDLAPQLLPDIAPHHQLTPLGGRDDRECKDALAEIVDGQEGSVADGSNKRLVRTLWMGVNTTATLHYDEMSNTYVQLSGRKRFLMLAPPDMLACHIFPYDHPSDRQCQFDLPSDVSSGGGTAADGGTTADFAQYPEARGIKNVYEVTLSPGDVLVMPAHVLHHVEALGLSISVNLWMAPESTEAMTRLFDTLEPMYEAAESTWKTRANTGRAIKYYIDGVVSGLGFESSAFADALIRRRWQPLYHGKGKMPKYKYSCGSNKKQPKRRAMLDGAVRSAVETFSQDFTKPYLREVNLERWMEHVLSGFLSPKNVLPFLRSCVVDNDSN